MSWVWVAAGLCLLAVWGYSCYRSLTEVRRAFTLVPTLIPTGAEITGRDLRQRLRLQGCRLSLPSFYFVMARLEDAKIVSGRYQHKKVDGASVKERVYGLVYPPTDLPLA